MVTTRRRITNEKDRFGGYGIQISDKPIAEESESVTSSRADRFTYQVPVDEPYAERTFARDGRTVSAPTEYAPVQQQPPVIEYSTRPMYPQTEPVRTPVFAPTRTKKSRKKEREDVMPSIRTRAYGQPEREENAVEQPRESVRMSGKSKAALFAYMAVVLALAITVIATGIAVSRIGGQADAIENEIFRKNEILAAQTAEIDRLTDMTYITGAAVEGGMEKVTNTTEVELLPSAEPMKYEGRTNWFDKFCDWLSGIIGG